MTGRCDSNQAAPQQPKSYVHGLLERVAASPSLIAPERTKELQELVQRHQIELHINDKGETSFDMGAKVHVEA